MKRLIFVFVLVLSLAIAIQAQDALENGVAVTGEITNDVFAVEYTWAGLADQVLVIELFPVDTLADYDRPMILVNDPEGDILLSYDSFGKTTAVVQLPRDGAYTIIATRVDEATGDSVGEYTLTVTEPVKLEVGAAIQASIDSETDQYYTYTGSGDFSLSFAKTGDFAPEVSVNVAAEYTEGGLDTVGAVYGASKATFGTFAGGSLYIIKVAEPLFSFNFTTITAEYTLELLAE